MFAWKRRNNGNDLIDLLPVDSRTMHPKPGGDTGKLIGGYVYDPKRVTDIGTAAHSQSVDSDSAVTFAPSEVIHVPLEPDPGNPLMGLSPLAAALADIDLDYGITDFTTAVLERGAVMDHALITKQRVSDPEARRIERRWLRRRAGPKNAGGLTVIDGTEGTLSKMGMSIGARDMGLADLRKLIEARILMSLDVPPIIVGSVVGLENATYSNYGQARLAFHEENTDPHLSRICSGLENGLVADYPEHRGKLIRIRPDLSHVMALLDWEDQRRRLALAEFNGAVTTRTEARAAVDRPALPGDDFSILPLNVQRLGIDGQPLDPPAKAPPTGFAPTPGANDEVSGRRRDRMRSAVANDFEAVKNETRLYLEKIGFGDRLDERTEAALRYASGHPRFDSLAPSDKADLIFAAVRELARGT
jgi:hypothetical protein